MTAVYRASYGVCWLARNCRNDFTITTSLTLLHYYYYYWYSSSSSIHIYGDFAQIDKLNPTISNE